MLNLKREIKLNILINKIWQYKNIWYVFTKEKCEKYSSI